MSEKDLVQTAVPAGEGNVPFTFFAPTDAAYAMVPKTALASLAAQVTKVSSPISERGGVAGGATTPARTR